jgi:hypothetical protein
MGHSSTRAALIYLHGSDTRQREIATTLGKLAGKELKGAAGRPGRPRIARHRARSGHGEARRLREERRRIESHRL